MFSIPLFNPCRRVLFSLVFLTCAGCGQKGDLYLPDKNEAALAAVEHSALA